MQVKLIINDEINCKFIDLPSDARNALYKKFKLPIPGARYSPAVKLGRWDGCANFFNMGGSTYINLLPDIIDYLDSKNISVDLIDNRDYQTNFSFTHVDENSYSHCTWPNGHNNAGQPIILRDYQVEAVNTFLDNPQSIQILATGSGKSLVTGILAHKVEQYGRTILIVPSKSLVEQTEEDYRNLGLDVGVLYGERKEYTRTHTICTWQSLGALAKNTKKNKGDWDDEFISIHELLDGVVSVVVDECHGSKAKLLFDLLSGIMGKLAIRWGLTGTLPEEAIDQMYLKIAIGDVVGELTASTLQDAGVLSTCDIHIKQLIDHVEFSNYQEELSYLVGNPDRLSYIAKQIIEHAKGGNTLILVGRTDTGEQLEQLIPDSVFINGSTKQRARKVEFNDIAILDNKILIATAGIAAVGLNLPRIFNLVFIEIGKSFVRTIQSVGRSLRKTDDKDHANIFDYCSTCKFSKKHLSSRKKFYKNANYPHTITKVDWK